MIAGLLRRLGLMRGAVLETLDGPPSLAHPVSQACTQAQLEEPLYASWCEKIAERPRMHRKQWEFVYILQVLEQAGLLRPGCRGLGFGVGKEPLPAYFASRGVAVLGTDMDPQDAHSAGWTETAQHAAGKEALNGRGLCEADAFESLVDFRCMDMTAIDPALAGAFDFCWSACALEHLGSIDRGLEFIENSLDCLRPGGLAVHTTELNCSSNEQTLDHASTVLFRRRDFEALGARLLQNGCQMALNFNLGDKPLDRHVDLPPYSSDRHLKLAIDKWTSTSFGIVVRKGPQA